MAASPHRSSTAPSSPSRANSPSVGSEHTPKTSGVRLPLVTALVLLFAWGLALLLRAGELVHVLLLAGLMLLMIAWLKARDATMQSARSSPTDER